LDRVDAIAAARSHAGLGISHRLVRPHSKSTRSMARHRASSPNWISARRRATIDAIGRVIRQMGHDLGDVRSGCLEDEVMWHVL
jgi:hypothetical protein